MPALVCPSCEAEVDAIAPLPGSSVQCRTCWAKVPVPAVNEQTPPPKEDIPTARPSAPRPKATPRKTRAVTPKKNGVWTAVAVGVIALCVAAGVTAAVVMNTTAPAQTDVPPPSSAPKPPAIHDPLDGWQATDAGDGVTLLAPGPLDADEIDVKHPDGTRPGRRFWAAAPDGTTAEVFVFEYGQTLPGSLVASFVEVPQRAVTKVGSRTLTSGNADVCAASHDSWEHAVLLYGVSGRWCVFHLKQRAETDPKGKRKERFIDQAAVSWTKPADPKPADPVKPKDPPKPDPKPTPPKPRDPRSDAEPITETWAALDTKAGFSGTAPKGVKAERIRTRVGGVEVGGKRWQIEDGHCVYHVSYFDLPADTDPDLQKLVKPLLVNGDGISGSADGRGGGRAATVWLLERGGSRKAKGFTAACGFRVFTAFVSSKHGKGYGDDPTFTQRTDKFLNALTLTFNPTTDDAYAGEPEWVGVPNAVGFTAKVPKGASSSKARPLGFPQIPGTEYRTEANGIVFEANVHTVPAKRTANDVVKDLMGHDKVLSGPEAVQHDGRKWTAYELGTAERPILFRAVAVGSKVYTLRAYTDGGGDDRAGMKELRDKAVRFFDTFSVEE